MNIKRRRYFKTGIVLLALTALLVGQAPSVAALATRQQTPGWVRQGYGDFPRLLIAAPGVDGSTLALYLVVDRFFDYPITLVNVWGDLVIAATVDSDLERIEDQIQSANERE